MSATPQGNPVFQYFDPATNLPLVGGKVYTYIGGTLTAKTTWADAGKLATNLNPVILDAAGKAQIFIDGTYKFIIKDSLGNLIDTIDGIIGGSGAFDKPASGITSLPFDDIVATNVQAALEELGAKRIKTSDSALILSLLTALGVMPSAGDLKPAAYTAAPTGWLACDGSNVSRATYPALFAALVTTPGYTIKTFTVTIASPGVVTRAAHGMFGGERVRLSTTGALPTGLAAGVDYYVVYVDANTFQLSSTFGGASIITTGSQSGTHSFTQSRFGLGDGSTTFTLPDSRDAFFRGLAASGRTLGAQQPEMIGPHTHTGTTGVNSVDHTHNLSSDAGRHGTNGADPGSNFYTSDGDTSGGFGAKTQATAGASVTHTHPITTDANSGTSNYPKNMGVPWFIKT